MKQLAVVLNGLELTLDGPSGREKLGINGDYPNTPLSQSIFSQLGLMHLIAPYLPNTVSANFPVSKPMKKLIGAMYQSENRKPPIFKTPKSDLRFSSPKTDVHKVAVAYSAGKDSLWNMWWAQEKFGTENVLAVHINGLNRANAPRERMYAERQRAKLGFNNFEVINLHNGSRSRGYGVMRSRDMFLVGITIPHALAFGASKIIIEGFAETQPTEPFSGQASNMRFFSQILRELGVPVSVTWRNRQEMDVMRDLLEHRPEWVSHVCNCFSAPCYQPGIRRYWQRSTPTFSLYDSQCGSCVKCRITNLGRILYDPNIQLVKTEDVQTFLKNTANWMKINRERLADMIEGSFTREFKRACKQYNLSIPSVA